MPLDASEFVATDTDSKAFITTLKLPRYVYLWAERDQRLSIKAQKHHWTSLSHNLEFVKDIISTWAVTASAPLRPNLLLSICLLLEYLEHMAEVIYYKPTQAVRSEAGPKASGQYTCLLSGTSWWGYLCPDIIEKRMLRAGWCVSDVSRLKTTVTLSGGYFASLLDRHPRNMSQVSSESAPD